MSDHGSDVEKDSPQDISCPKVVEKYHTAAEIANAALKLVISGCVPGADSFSLCALGDAFVTNECKKVYQKKDKSKKKIEKGIAFPTCISINEVCANFSPVDSSTPIVLARGDLIKVDLGVHIDGFVSLVGHTVCVCASNQTAYAAAPSAAPAVQEAVAIAIAKPGVRVPQITDPKIVEEIEGRKADVMKACWTAAEAAIRQIRVGGKSGVVTKVIEAVAKEYECNPMQGVLCHQLKKHVIEGSKCFPLSLTSAEEKIDEFEFSENEVYAIDIVMSTGDGRAREADVKPTVYRRAVERKYILKSQLGRHFMSEVESKFPALPFSLRQVSDERACLVGVAEAMRHELLIPYPVVTDKVGEFTAQFKFTVQLTANGLKKVTGLTFGQERLMKPLHELKSESLKALLATSLNPKKNKKKAMAESK